MGTPRIMLRDMSDLDGIFPSYITGEMSRTQYWTRQGWHIMSCVQYRHEGKRVIIHTNIIMEKVLSDHMTFSSLG